MRSWYYHRAISLPQCCTQDHGSVSLFTAVQRDDVGALSSSTPWLWQPWLGKLLMVQTSMCSTESPGAHSCLFSLCFVDWRNTARWRRLLDRVRLQNPEYTFTRKKYKRRSVRLYQNLWHTSRFSACTCINSQVWIFNIFRRLLYEFYLVWLSGHQQVLCPISLSVSREGRVQQSSMSSFWLFSKNTEEIQWLIWWCVTAPANKTAKSSGVILTYSVCVRPTQWVSDISGWYCPFIKYIHAYILHICQSVSFPSDMMEVSPTSVK